MTITLSPSNFVNGVYSVTYGLRKAKFTIIDEEYDSGSFSASVHRMICDVQTFDSNGNLLDEKFGSLVIGLGDSLVAVTSSDVTLLGKLLSSANMASCSVELYEQ